MAGLFLGIGAGPGIGLSTARRFATEGFRIVLAGRKVERLEALADDLRRGPNAGVEIASVDCSDSLQVGELVGRYAPDLEVIHYNAAVVRAQFSASRAWRRSLKISRWISPALWSLSGKRAQPWCRGAVARSSSQAAFWL
jgi:short-subunit dehydrogenase